SRQGFQQPALVDRLSPEHPLQQAVPRPTPERLVHSPARLSRWEQGLQWVAQQKQHFDRLGKIVRRSFALLDNEHQKPFSMVRYFRIRPQKCIAPQAVLTILN